jgi:alpha-ketoglutarate-dependent taurine dioxygenase
VLHPRVELIETPILQCSHVLADTLWASGYEIYDRISAPYRKFLETLTVTCGQKKFAEVAKRAGFELFEGPRGAPENIGRDLTNVHPLVRTNPVTGWKSIFAVGVHVEKVNGLSEMESEHLKDVFLRLIMENHDLQVRHRWVNPNDVGKLPAEGIHFSLSLIQSSGH